MMEKKPFKLRFRGRCFFTVFCLMLVFMLQWVPAVVAYTTDEVYKSSYEYGWETIPYGDGIDNDMDGTVDEMDGSEADVIYGTGNYSQSNNVVYDTWYDDYQRDGVIVGGGYEILWRIQSSENISISPTQTCYSADVVGSGIGTYQTITDVVNVVTFFVDIPPSKIMNGASEFWYRSPLNWERLVYDWDMDGGIEKPYWYLNIYDDDNNLVYASQDWDKTIPEQRAIQDDSGYRRIYEKINMNFKSDTKYRFEEYVNTDSDTAINDVELFMAQFQDVAGDGLTDTYCFYGTNNMRKVECECSWSCIFTLGKGLQGGEKIIFGEDGTDDITIVTQWINGSDAIDDADSARVVFPLRTTRPLNITGYYRVTSGSDIGLVWHQFDDELINVTGTLIYDFNVTDPNATEPNIYQFKFDIHNLNESYSNDGVDNDGDGFTDEADEQAMTFYMYPLYGDFIYIENMSSVVEANHFSAHIELAWESEDPVATEESGSVNLLSMLLGFLIIAIGIILIVSVVGAPFGVPLISVGVSVATAVSAFGVAFMTIGSALVVAGAMGVDPVQFVQSLIDMTLRIASGIIKGIEAVAGAIWNGLMWVINKIMEIGEAIMYWGSIILNAMAEIMYFVAFIIVMLLWSWFLTSMKYLAQGDIESAWASFKKPMRTYPGKLVTKRVKRVGGYYEKEATPWLKEKERAGRRWGVKQAKRPFSYIKRRFED